MASASPSRKSLDRQRGLLFRAPLGFVERYTLLRVLQTIFQRQKLVFKSKNLWVRSTYYLDGGPTKSRSFM
jgi:hypothetical protein